MPKQISRREATQAAAQLIAGKSADDLQNLIADYQKRADEYQRWSWCVATPRNFRRLSHDAALIAASLQKQAN